jgi:endonuclease/exonuclease/phosphatase family metal-dependent hydrolase
MSIKIAIFSFNTEAQLFCCKCNEKETCGAPRKFFDFFGPKCVLSDFATKFIADMVKFYEPPDIFIISLQESSIKNPKKGFKSDQLIEAFFDCVNKNIQDVPYSKFSEKMEGVGIEGVRGLRISLIINQKIKNPDIRFLFYRPLFESKISISEGQHFGKGAIMLDLQFNKEENNKFDLSFINTHLPFLEKKTDLGKSVRNQTIKETMEYFQKKIKSDEQKWENKKIFFMGDLNYRMDFGENKKAEEQFIDLLKKNKDTATNEIIINAMPEYLKYDQLTNSIGDNNLVLLKNFKEGVDNKGPNFLPTCKLIKKCPIENRREYQLAKGKRVRVPSWCDRILYHGDNIDCKLYNSFDNGQTCKSDHIPVIAFFEIKNPKQTDDATGLKQAGNDTNLKQVGGNANMYYQKYLKYKQKYLDLKENKLVEI